MTDILSLLVVAALGYFMILDFEPKHWFKESMNKFFGVVEVLGVANNLAAWVLCVGFPAILAGLIGVALTWELLNFIFDVVILLMTTAIGSFMRYHKSLLRAVYSNDVNLASKLANDWVRSEEEIVDSKDRFIQRMLKLSAVRLHIDVLSVFFWYMLLGPAGAVLIAAHQAFEEYGVHWEPKFSQLNSISDSVSVFLFGTVGNMRPALETMGRLDVGVAALAASGFSGESYDIEKVPNFGNSLMITFFLALGGSATILFLYIV